MSVRERARAHARTRGNIATQHTRLCTRVRTGVAAAPALVAVRVGRVRAWLWVLGFFVWRAR